MQAFLIITPTGLLFLNKHQQSCIECPHILHTKHLGVGFLQDVFLSTSVPALFKYLLCAKAFPFYELLVILK